MRLADLFCGGGGAGFGYHLAGFDVVGVDNRPQPSYPFEFHQADAFTFDLSGFDAVHASPPCHDHSKSASLGTGHGTGWMLAATRKRLEASGLPWVIENVPGAPMRVDYELCGCMFPGLAVRRERWFETSWGGFDLIPPHDHSRPAVTIFGNGGVRSHMRSQPGAYVPIGESRAAMGISWMNTQELKDAIPPAYTEWVGLRLLEYLES